MYVHLKGFGAGGGLSRLSLNSCRAERVGCMADQKSEFIAEGVAGKRTSKGKRERVTPRDVRSPASGKEGACTPDVYRVRGVCTPGAHSYVLLAPVKNDSWRTFPRCAGYRGVPTRKRSTHSRTKSLRCNADLSWRSSTFPNDGAHAPQERGRSVALSVPKLTSCLAM